MRFSNRLRARVGLARLLAEGGLGRHMAVGGVGTLAVRGTGMALIFVSTVVLTRSLGSLGYGQYALCYSIVSLLSLVGVVGFDRLVIRQLSGYVAHGDWARCHGLLRSAHEIVVGSSLILMAAAVGVGILLLRALLLFPWVGDRLIEGRTPRRA